MQCLPVGVHGAVGEFAQPLVEVADSKGQGDVWEATRVLEPGQNSETATHGAVLNVSPYTLYCQACMRCLKSALCRFFVIGMHGTFIYL